MPGPHPSSQGEKRAEAANPRGFGCGTGLATPEGMKPIASAAVATMVALILWAAASHAGPPTDQLQTSIDKVFQALADPQLKGPEKADERRAAVFTIAETLFDFGHTAKLTLGSYWDTLSADQRDEFTKLFKGFIQKSYLSNIDFSDPGKLVYTAEAVEGDRAVVKSRIVTTGGSEIPVDFRLIQSEPGRWRLYDVNVEGMSLVGNYRVQFGRVIKASSYDDLVQKLRVKQQ